MNFPIKLIQKPILKPVNLPARLWPLLLTLCLFTACGSKQSQADFRPVNRGTEPLINSQRMRDVVRELSGIEYYGRLPGSAGDKLTQTFLVEQFKQIGLQPALQNSYLQSFSSTIVEPDGTSHANPSNPLLGQSVSSNNILGLLPGSDPQLRHELIIISAHHDHLGWTADGRYYPGANDDLSGLAAMLELARAFKALHDSGKPNKRSLLFVAYGAEEQYEMGSMYHAAHPLADFPNNRIALMISIDMMGLGYQDWRHYSAQQRHAYVARWLEQMHNENREDSDAYSHEYPPQDSQIFSYDAGPFSRLGVPNRVFGRAQGIVHYHQTSDTWDTLDYPSAAIFTRTLFDFLQDVDRSPARAQKQWMSGHTRQS